jgi:putative nucleotidyltransferase with HDIG domain
MLRLPAVLSLALVLVPLTAQEKHTLRYTFKPGHVCWLEQTFDMAQEVKRGEMDMKMTQVTTSWAESKTAEVKDGVAAMESRYTRVTAVSDMGGRKSEYDSDVAGSKPGPQLAGLADMVGKMPPSTVCGDFGCGNAHIARTVRKANADLVVAGAMLHDIGKVEAYGIAPDGFSHTSTGTLLGHVTLGALMFDRRLHASDLALSPAQRDEMLHFILSHHGALEFGSPVQPMTTEAEIVHWADEASAKATDMMDELQDPELFPPGGTNDVSAKRSWRLGRRLWRRPAAWD